MTKRVLKQVIEDLKRNPITSPQDPPAVNVEITKLKNASAEKIAKLKILESVSIAFIRGIVTIYGVKVLLEQQLYSSHSIVVIFLMFIYFFKEDGKRLDWFDIICICALMFWAPIIMTKIGAF